SSPWPPLGLLQHLPSPYGCASALVIRALSPRPSRHTEGVPSLLTPTPRCQRGQTRPAREGAGAQTHSQHERRCPERTTPPRVLRGLVFSREDARKRRGAAGSAAATLEPGPAPAEPAMAETDPKTVQDLTAVVQTLLQQMQDKFQTMSDQIIGRIDDMSCRIDDLEKNIADLMTQAGVEELEGENKTPAANKS
uniref:Heat shock factor-binding protein 1 n=4 Tax=Neoaves TaxID=3078114 RepID=A0A672UFE1_STRHB